jgi:hypothetical protein
MNIEDPPLPLFQPIDSEAFNNYLGITPTLIGAFAFEVDDEPEVSLSLFKNNLLLKSRAKLFYIL